MAVMNSEMWNEGESDQGGLSRDDILTVVHSTELLTKPYTVMHLLMYSSPPKKIQQVGILCHSAATDGLYLTCESSF